VLEDIIMADEKSGWKMTKGRKLGARREEGKQTKSSERDISQHSLGVSLTQQSKATLQPLRAGRNYIQRHGMDTVCTSDGLKYEALSRQLHSACLSLVILTEERSRGYTFRLFAFNRRVSFMDGGH
jgi:hypothetical protein